MKKTYLSRNPKIKVAINGYGRIGRCFHRQILDSNDIELVAINSRSDAATHAHLLKYDSVMGVYDAEVGVYDQGITVNGREIPVTSHREPADIPWGEHGAEYVLECTGFFRDIESTKPHIDAGASKVVLSAPAKGAVKTIVMGVNEEEYDPTVHHVVSNASCTTNCLAPVAQVILDNFGIKRGLMTTIHAYTGDQPTLDRRHDDLYRARAAAMSMIPTSTGAAKALGEVLPNLKGRLDGSAIRVPTPNVSAVDLTFRAGREVSAEEVNAAVEEASKGHMSRVLGYEPAPLVSTDFNHTEESSIFAPDQTRVVDGRMVRVLAWYDNEWGFSVRMADVATAMGRLN